MSNSSYSFPAYSNKIIGQSVPNQLKVSNDGLYTEAEKRVLLTTSKINNKEYVPFMDVDLLER